MPELRKDPVTGRWVIIATERAKRPSQYGKIEEEKKGGFCPFCPGNEKTTPPEVLSYRPTNTLKDQEGWWLRVVPNKFPALLQEGSLKRSADGMYDMMTGYGAHEVLIESPNHEHTYGDLPEEQIQEIIWALRDRVVELRKETRMRYIMIFKNHGREAGASLEHPHTQVIALPIVPKRVQEELSGSSKYYEYKERCVFCDMIQQEQEDGTRIVMETDNFLSYMPFASRFPFETCIIPKEHSCFFNDIQKNQVVELAAIMKRTFGLIKQALSDPHYNFVIHTTPFDETGNSPYYHWHIEIMPKLTKVAGFEWGTGFYINPTPPEVATKYLLDVAAKQDQQAAPPSAGAQIADLH
ncbi:MAG: galactose-1-phosphate uridylyltransferase [Candidatus Sumerlaeaceae bacterium]|nr:galactose-1-phosphate uridylyltransferase [Candidatus Sumerlaeaceae bacterium]